MVSYGFIWSHMVSDGNDFLSTTVFLQEREHLPLSLYPYRLANQMPELKLLLQPLGEASKSKPLPLLQASFTIPLALPDKNQNKAARSGGEREA